MKKAVLITLMAVLGSVSSIQVQSTSTLAAEAEHSAMNKQSSAQKAMVGSFEQMTGKANDLDKLVASAIAGQAPGEINEPKPSNGDKEGDS